MDKLEQLGRLQMRLQYKEVLSVSKDLAKKIGLLESVMYSELVNRAENFYSKNMLSFDEFISWTISECENEIGIGETFQRRVFSKLQELGLIEIKNLSDNISCKKRHFKVVTNESILKRILEQEE